MMFFWIWLFLGLTGLFISTYTDRHFYGQSIKLDIGLITTSCFIGPITYIIIIKSIYLALKGKKKK